MPQTKLSKANINYTDDGKDEPALLFLPGWCANKTAFDDLIPALKETNRCLALDWRGHGESGTYTNDFGEKELVDDALAVIEASGVGQVIPAATAHSGWVALELRKKLGGQKIPKLILIDWLVLDPPPPFLGALAQLQEKAHWEQTREALFNMWTEGMDNRKVKDFVFNTMGNYGFEMWSRGGREISSSYRRYGSPLKALSLLEPKVPTLHIYAQPDDPGYLQAQQEFSSANPWFKVSKLNARSHFPMLEVPKQMAQLMKEFILT